MVLMSSFYMILKVTLVLVTGMSEVTLVLVTRMSKVTLALVTVCLKLHWY